MILGFLPLLLLIAVTILIANVRSKWQWRTALLRAAILTGVYAIISLELLSLWEGATRLGVVLVWMTPLLVIIIFLAKQATTGEKIVLPKVRIPPSWFDRAILLGIISIVVITGFVAWTAPPNTYDSLTYHMSRVAHWAQEKGVVPYASGVLRQNYMSPGSEMLILHTYILTQSDRFANLVQWFAMIISLIAISQITADLGAKTRGQLLAVLFAATLPMGIAQASSTMTDYVTAAWVILAVCAVMKFVNDQRPMETLPFAAAAAGLAILTKPTSTVFLLPFAVWVFVKLAREYSLKHTLGYLVLAVMIVIVLNLGYLMRNWQVFGNFFGGNAQVQLFTNETMNFKVLISNILRNASLHAGTRWEWLNDQLYLLLVKVHWKLDLGLTDERTSIHPFFTIWPYPSDEARATNTIQAVLILIAMAIVLFRRKSFDRSIFTYGILLVTGFVLFSVVFKFDILASRYHMPFFILAAPFVGVSLEKHSLSWSHIVISLLLLIGSIPILLGLDSRSILASDQTGSILTLRRLDQYFSQAPTLDEPYFLMTKAIKAADCRQVGLMLSGNTAEYPLWVLLDSPDDEITIDWIISKNDPSGSFRIKGFEPCAIICEGCDSYDDSYNDLPLALDSYGFRLYLKNIR